MEIIRLTGRPPKNASPLVLAMGKFDGVHIGHQSILRVAKAKPESAGLAVMSFWPHPAWVLRGNVQYERALTPFAEKVKLLQSFGVDTLYDVRFSRDFASTSAEQFVFEHLGQLNLKSIVVGEDYHFGQGGKAGVSELKAYCQALGVPVTVVSHVEENGVKVSSSQVRKHLANGRVEAAEALLGRPYTVTAAIEHGAARGRTLGFPTANLEDTGEYVMPKAGVYAISASIAEEGSEAVENWFGVLNAGTRPTVDGESFKLEAHLFGFSGDLYGKILRVSFLRRVRDEVKFAGLDELKAQIHKDVATVKEMLGM
ncbi:bifunctional riboflavin kinase/FAD synthetase [Alicyclobacillus tolerans]|uniref:bifunctional riboflavin kinase/FAD synthetase n=1 Tax=Alicyclobacillus tolerans TaxID=90970 RepID=UPI001F00F6B7|nr:bifunctional riboflavin kinase/FAD synthetase [Alicyclobacillus tolerans]MCF8564799.1 bifunctional riboflavin kinase/FAD synthetase [Alicyclobacillus tolerans]